MKTRLLLLLMGAALPLAAQAFQIKTRSENPNIGEDALRAATVQAAADIGSRIPEDANIKVYVYSRAMPSKIEGQTIYLHRVQLTKAFAGGPPYPYRGWLPVRTVEYYGVDDAVAVRIKLDEVLREFFTTMKNVDPAKGVE